MLKKRFFYLFLALPLIFSCAPEAPDSGGDEATNMFSIEEAYYDNSIVDNERTSNNALLDSNLTYHDPNHDAWSGASVIDFPMH